MELFRGFISRNPHNQHEHHHNHNHHSFSRRDSEQLEHGSACAFDVQQVHTPPPIMEEGIESTSRRTRETFKPILSKDRSEDRHDRLVFSLPL